MYITYDAHFQINFISLKGCRKSYAYDICGKTTHTQNRWFLYNPKNLLINIYSNYWFTFTLYKQGRTILEHWIISPHTLIMCLSKEPEIYWWKGVKTINSEIWPWYHRSSTHGNHHETQHIKICSQKIKGKGQKIKKWPGHAFVWVEQE